MVAPHANFKQLCAVFGQSVEEEISSGQSRRAGTTYYGGRVKTDDPDSVGREVASVLQDAPPYAFRWDGGEDEAEPPARDPDWPALAAFYASKVQYEPTVRGTTSIGA